MAKVRTKNNGFGKEAARVVIIRAGDMNAGGRRRIAAWLRREATFLEKNSDQMANRYTARWLYGE